jgi:aldose 1-epimerase
MTTGHPHDHDGSLRSPDGLVIRVSDFGATWRSCQVPMPDGATREALIDTADLHDPHRLANYAGATVGRYANRIAHARLQRDGQVWPLVPQSGSAHQLHGGPDGWSHRRWAVVAQADDHIELILHSPEGDQGFPGAVTARVRYSVRPGLRVCIDYEAVSDAATPVAMTSHAYFNLDAPAPDGPTDARQHRLWLDATHLLPVDAALIPLGGLQPVTGGAFDFSTPRPADAQPHAEDPQVRAAGGGYDHGWLLARTCAGAAADALRLTSADGRLTMALRTTMPALQFYDGRALADMPTRDGLGRHRAGAGLALEPGWLADSPNRPDWPQPTCWLAAGEVMRHRIEYRFEPR